MKKFFISLMMMAMVASMILAVTQVGSLIVTIKSKEGQLLPGASVMIKSANMIGTRTQATGANGKTTFRNLTPGEYVVNVNMDKFQPVERSGVYISIQKTTKIDVELELGAADEVITVVATSPIIDTSSSTVTQDFDFENSINHMPTGRHYADILGAAGGVRDQNNPSVMGSGSYDNLYLIDGINTTDTRSQTWGEQFNVDVIQDVNVQTGGISAEYGQFQGAVMNVVTKSGANHLTGLIRLEMGRVGWNPVHEVEGVERGADGDNWDYSGGGPLWPDLIWWYVGYNEYNSTRQAARFVNPLDLTETIPLIRPYLGHTLLIKGTAQPTEDFRVLFTYMDSPIEIENVQSWYYSRRTQTSADWRQIQGSNGTLIGNASYILGEEAFLEARYTMTRGVLTIEPQIFVEGSAVAAELSGPMYTDFNWYWGSSYARNYSSDRNMDVMGIAYNWLLDTESLGNHDIKIGVDYQDLWSIVSNSWYAGNEWIWVDAQTGHSFADWQNAGPLARYVYENRLDAAETHETYYSVYIQDSIEVGENLTINFGLRSDPNTMTNNQDEEIISFGIFDSIAPRVGLTYDFGNGLSARASFGRYYDMTTLYLLDNFNTYPVPETVTLYVWNGAGWSYLDDWENGSPVSPHSVEDGFGMQYTDDVNVGFDYQISNDLAISLSGIWRQYRDLQVREDINEDKVYVWRNVDTDEYGTLYKEYMAAILKVTKRPTEDNLYLQATLHLESNEGLTATDNASRAGYYQDNYQTNETAGEWWGDFGYETLKFRGQATYFFLNGWYAGVNYQWHNNIRETSSATRITDGGTAAIYYPNGRADMDRLDAYSQLDLQLGIETTIEFPFDVPLTDNDILLGVYVQGNFLDNWQGVIGVEQRLSSPDYGTADTWASSTTWTLGFRLEM